MQREMRHEESAADRVVPGDARLYGILALVIGLAASTATATPITVGGAGGPAFQVDPIYFKGFNQSGLTGPGVARRTTPSRARFRSSRRGMRLGWT